jgi:1,4-dihydroxy-2-naphthoyl-CoA hydrolase
MITPDQYNAFQKGHLPDYLGILVEEATPDRFIMAFVVQKHHHAPNGYLHAGAVVTLADTACGYATVQNLPEGAKGFTTIELKSNFFATAKQGKVRAVAVPVHRGRTTQVWDAEVVSEESGKRMALFRCTQAILWDK